MNKKHISSVIVAVIVVILGGFLIWKNIASQPSPTMNQPDLGTVQELPGAGNDKPTSTDNNQMSGWKEYESEELGIRFSYPEDWQIKMLSDGRIGITSLEFANNISSPSSPSVEAYLNVSSVTAKEFDALYNELQENQMVIDENMTDNGQTLVYEETNEHLGVGFVHQLGFFNTDTMIDLQYQVNTSRGEEFQKIFDSISLDK